MKRRNILLNILTALPALICAIALGYYVLQAPVVKQDQGVIYNLTVGKSKQSFIHDLAQNGVIQHPWVFSMYTYPQKSAQLKTGEYLFPKGSSMLSIWRQVTSGTGLYYRPFTIIPGWTFMQLRQALAKIDALSPTMRILSDVEVMVKLGYPSVSPEGEFMSDTYFYTRGDTDFSIIKRAFTLMQTKFAAQWTGRATGLPYNTPYQALTVASLVEREALLNNERPIIAGVIVNRLNKHMLLQIDPTVIFGMGSKYTGNITREDLRTDTPYNTYMRKGLPPSPIAMPSMNSIQAVLHPAQHDYLYFVARGDGSHQFSKSLPEHNAAVAAAALLRENKKFFNESMLRRQVMPQLTSNLDIPFLYIV